MAADQLTLSDRVTCTARLFAPGVILSAGLLVLRWATSRLLARLLPKRAVEPQCPKAGQLDPLWVSCGFSASEVERFGRQIILPKLGPEGQRNILKASVLVVGAGGLGCPVAVYLCGAGIGRIGIVDDDTVSVSNLHRQVGHTWKRVGENKAASLKRTCLGIHSDANIETHMRRLTSLPEAVELVSRYDLVIDCTDAPASRYLLNDAAVKARKPLVAVSAVGLSGQLSVYNWKDGPCLRCIFPDMPSASAAEPVASCAESGVMGPVPGILGTLAALEALKLAAGGPLAATCLNGRMLLYDALESTQPFRTMRIRKREGCRGCGEGSALDEGLHNFKYEALCACTANSAERAEGNATSVTASEVATSLRSGRQMIVIDVRPTSHFAVSHLAHSWNWPLPKLLRSSGDEMQTRISERLGSTSEEPAEKKSADDEPLIVCVCRRGNDSLLATSHLQKAGIRAKNLVGGLQVLVREVQAPFEAPALT